MRTKRVLLVDDEEIITKSLGRELQAEGYLVRTADDGESAVVLLQQESFDLVITDLRMGGLDGIGVLKKAKEIVQHLPVIILTGYGDMASAIDALRLGADDYIPKPCDLNELLIRMTRCFEKQDLLQRIQLQNRELHEEITARKNAEKALQESHALLEQRVNERTVELEETNVALKVLLEKREQDKFQLAEQLLANVKQLVEPFLGKLLKSGLNDRQKYYAEIIKTSLSEVVSSGIQSHFAQFLNLTPTEIQVAILIRQGKKTKEIAELLNLAPGTIDGHRKNIRKKIGITNCKTSLRDLIVSSN